MSKANKTFRVDNYGGILPIVISFAYLQLVRFRHNYLLRKLTSQNARYFPKNIKKSKLEHSLIINLN